MSQVQTICVVIPCYNSERTIERVVNLSREEIASLGYKARFVLVNDCSSDATFSCIEKLSTSGDVVGIDLSRNFGQHGAILCGLSHATGDLVLLMDDDMQTHPSQIGRLVHELEISGEDVVFARYAKREEALWRRAGSAFWHKTMQVMTGCPDSIELTSFVIMKMWVAKKISEYEGPFPVLQGLVFQATSHVTNADVKHFDREAGKSGYTLKALVRLWSNAMNFSMLPIRAATAMGLIMGLSGCLAVVFLIIRRLLHPEIPVGWSSLMVTILTCSGLLLLALGIVGEYVGRIFLTANGAPQYVERRVVGTRIGDESSTE